MDKNFQKAIELITSLIDEDDCWYDHHGYCQAHGLSDYGTCPHKLAKYLLMDLRDDGYELDEHTLKILDKTKIEEFKK